MKIPELKTEHIFVAVMISYLFVGLVPMGFPFGMSEITVEIYELVENLPPGSIIIQGGSGVFAFDLESAAAMIACIKQLERNDLKLVNIPFGVEAVQFQKYCVDSARVDESFGGTWEYGVDWVQLPYIPGGSAALISLLDDVHGTVETDVYGTPLSELPIMDDLRSWEDIDLWTCPHYGYSMIVQFVTVEKDIPSINFAQTSCYIDWSPMMAAYPGKIYLTAGFLGGAQYEKLMDLKGLGHAAMDGYGIIFLVYLVAIVLGNITMYAKRGKEEEMV